MDILNNLTQTVDKPARRLGRGYGSKKGGHTSSRGSKGDKVRGKTKITFDGTKIKKGWIKRTPFLRGKHRTLKMSINAIFQLEQIDKMFKSGDTVDAKTLNCATAKILSKGDITKALNFRGVKMSESAKAKIIAAGGKID
ncbi:uL15 family ribosomal protein [Candidatus Shapirobacteria bacterium]|nr:uL15 family ribosomal protein [Candidatus Shapirobacteria bacterium]